MTRCPHCGGALELTAIAERKRTPKSRIDDRTVEQLRKHDPPLISARLYHGVRNMGLSTVDDMAVLPDQYWRKLKNFGQGTLQELRALAPFRVDHDRQVVAISKMAAKQQFLHESVRHREQRDEEQRMRSMVARMYGSP